MKLANIEKEFASIFPFDKFHKEIPSIVDINDLFKKCFFLPRQFILANPNLYIFCFPRIFKGFLGALGRGERE